MTDRRDDEAPPARGGQPADPQRRRFLAQGVGATLGLGALALGARSVVGDGEKQPGAEKPGSLEPAEKPNAPSTVGAEPTAGPHVQRYVKLGATDLEVSDISFGTGGPTHPKALLEALDRGVNYVDTAEGYPLGGRPGAIEQMIGALLGARRPKVVLGTKTVAEPDDDRDTLMGRLDASLRRLRTDFIDLYFNHAVNDLARLKNPEWFEFVERAKRAGKIRYAGMSGHGGHLIECLDHALDEGLVDVILAAHNFGQDPAFYERFTRSFDLVANQVDLPRVLAKAHAKGVGVLVMKTLMGARLNDMRPWETEGSTFSHAAFRWVLSNPNVDALVATMKSPEVVREYLAASGAASVGAADLRLLRRYAAQNGDAYCRHGCRACLPSCSEGLDIPELMRARMYATDYGALEQARGALRERAGDLASCLACAHRSCVGACPQGIDIGGRIRGLPGLLDMAPDAKG